MTEETNSTTFSLNMSPTSNTIPPSETRADKCIDFISELPSDLVISNILPRILGRRLAVIYLDQPCNYLDVCSRWMELIASLDDDIITFSTGTIRSQAWRLRAVAPYIKSLRIGSVTVKSASRLVAQCSQFPLLTKLQVTHVSSQENVHMILKTMPALVHLEIGNMEGRVMSFGLFELLDEYPKLTHLEVASRRSMSLTSMPIGTQRSYPNLVHLQWISDTPLLPCVHYFPNLRVLRLSKHPTLRDLSIIHHICAKLQQLVVNNDRVIPEIYQLTKRNKLNGPGLRFLFIHGDLLTSDWLQTLMIQHCHTIEMCVLEEPNISEAPAINNIINKDIEFSRLESFTYPSFLGSDWMRIFEWIIQHAPNLATVKATSGPVVGSVLRASTDRPLQSILLKCGPSRQQNEYRFIEHHVALRMDSSLQELRCIMDEPTENECWIHLIPGLTQLKSLELQLGPNINYNTLTKLILDLPHGCPSLERLVLVIPYMSSYEWILPLSKIRHLKYLTIDARKIPDHILTQFGCFRYLDTLDLTLGMCNSDCIAELKRLMPNLVYTIKDY